MHKSKLIQYLSVFSLQDLRNFRDFVHSPYFNKHEKTTELLDYILETKNFESPALEISTVFEKLFPGKPFKEQLLRTVMSYLVKLVFRFYCQIQQEKDPIEQQLQLLEKALQEGQQKMFNQHSQNWEKTTSQESKRDANNFLRASRFERLQDNYDINYGQRTSGLFLEKALSNFDTYYFSEKLRLTCEMLARKQVTGQDYSYPLLFEIIAYLERENNHFESISEVWIYYLIFKMMSENNDAFYFRLKHRLEKDAALFAHQEGRDLYTHALNYCIRKLNFGETTFKKETFELYQQMLSNGLLYVDKILPQWDYTNIVKLGCDLEESEWTYNFIAEQKENLSSIDRENTFTYNLAVFQHSQKKYDQAISLLHKVEFTEVYNNLLTRILMLKIYFETKDWRALEYYLDAFRLYLLRNKKLEDNRRKSVLKLIKYSRSLYRLIEKKKTYSIEVYTRKINKIKASIEADEKILNKKWLLQIIEE